MARRLGDFEFAPDLPLELLGMLILRFKLLPSSALESTLALRARFRDFVAAEPFLDLLPDGFLASPEFLRFFLSRRFFSLEDFRIVRDLAFPSRR